MIRAYIQHRTLEHYRRTQNKLGEANCLKAIGDVCQFQKDMVTALARYEAAIALFRGVGDKLGEGNVLGALGNFYFAQAQYEQARSLQQQRLTRMQTIGDRYSEAAAWYYLGKTCGQLAATQAGSKGEEGDRAGN